MRLLNSSSPEIKEFSSEDSIPPYAIVSHRWGNQNDEVKFQDWQPESGISLASKPGYRKIEYCRNQAKSENIDWIWIDTCCIDKTSSAELSEAINSMFKWYQKAKVCYVYLSDVRGIETDLDPEDDQASAEELLNPNEWFKTEWFKRGWTLQELLAPTDLDIYTTDWTKLGTKIALCDIISETSGIEKEFLRGEDLRTASVSKKMSWAAGRKTSRTEDTAYCLLGIFDVNMPLIYGEGRKAFTRLQHEIMKMIPHDHTLFAWGDIVEQSRIYLPTEKELWADKCPPWKPETAERKLHGLLAESPEDFRNSWSFQIHPDASWHYKVDGRFSKDRPMPSYDGVYIALPLEPLMTQGFMESVHYLDELQITQFRRGMIAGLYCRPSSHTHSLLALSLQMWGTGNVGRTRELLQIPFEQPWLPIAQTPLCVEPERHNKLQDGDFIFRRMQFDPRCDGLYKFLAHPTMRVIESHTFLRIDEQAAQGRLFGYHFDETTMWSDAGLRGHFGIVFGRNTQRQVTAELIPLVNGMEQLHSVQYHGLTWYSPHNILTRSFLSDTQFGKTMAIPHDSWTFESTLLPKIFVEVERRQLADDRGSIDLVDLVILPPNMVRRPRLQDVVTQTDSLENSVDVQKGHNRQTAKLQVNIKNTTESSRKTKVEVKRTFVSHTTIRKHSNFPRKSDNLISTTKLAKRLRRRKHTLSSYQRHSRYREKFLRSLHKARHKKSR